MSTAVMTNRLELTSVAEKSLNAAAVFWFLVAVIGQWIFVGYIMAFYGRAVGTGDLGKLNKVLTHGYIPGDHIGNVALAVHVLMAAIITVGGPLQLIPQIRSRVPRFHRWNGRIYMLTAVTTSIAGLYLVWVRGTVGNTAQHIGTSIMALLIVFCSAMTLRYALARDFATHRRWALRMFIVVSGSWFIRVGAFLSLLVIRGAGLDPTPFQDPLFNVWSFAQYLLPLAVLEIYLRARDRSGTTGKLATASGLTVLTLAMGVGIFAVTTAVWVPKVKAAYDPRISIAETLSATIASGGIDQAAKQYHDLRAAASPTYNFDEDELNNLGYQFLRAKKFKEAIRILQLNVEAYPQSANAYDSLGEAFMDDGNKPLAIANYRRSLQLNPKNDNAVQMLRKINAGMI